jgi:hypothetical protein
MTLFTIIRAVEEIATTEDGHHEVKRCEAVAEGHPHEGVDEG